MSDKEFEELFEAAPDWRTAVAGLRIVMSKEKEPESALALLKDTPAETILSLMACHLVEIKGASMSRYMGGELEFSAPPFHTFVLRKAFHCYRRELVPDEVIQQAERAKLDAEKAQKIKRAAYEKLPPELRERGY